MLDKNAERVIENLFNENFHLLVFSSYRIIQDYSHAEDIVQNVFVKSGKITNRFRILKTLNPICLKRFKIRV